MSGAGGVVDSCRMGGGGGEEKEKCETERSETKT